MAEAPRDENYVPAALFEIDGQPGQVMPGQIDQVTGRILVDVPGGSGSVTSVSVVSANGFAGSVANPTSTPAITLSTTITGILRGNGTNIAAITIGSGLAFDGTTLSATGGGSGITIGTTTITSGTNTRILYNNSGVVGEYTLTGSGTVVVMQTAPTFVTSITTPTILATANDSGAIGASGTAFSDLFLASGGTINWNAGNMVLTHSAGVLTLSDTNPGGQGPIFEIFNDSISPAASDIVGNIDFYGRDSAANKQIYGRQFVTITDTTTTSEDATMTWALVVAGAITNEMLLSNTALTPVTNDGLALGSSTLMWGDLFLATGGVVNFNNGDVTITHSTDQLAFAGATTNGYTFADGPIRPSANDGIALGTATVSFADLFLASGAVINFANGNTVLTHSSGILTLTTGDLRVTTAGTNTASVVTVGGTQTLTNKTLTSPVISTIVNTGTLTLPTSTDTLVGRATTDTLTNKRVTPRTGTVASSATPTINTDNVDFYSITALTVDITSFTTNLSGTPTDGQKLWIAITGTASRAITWGSSFEASTVALPTTTSGTSRLDVGFVWNTATSKWRCIAVA